MCRSISEGLGHVDNGLWRSQCAGEHSDASQGTGRGIPRHSDAFVFSGNDHEGIDHLGTFQGLGMPEYFFRHWASRRLMKLRLNTLRGPRPCPYSDTLHCSANSALPSRSNDVYARPCSKRSSSCVHIDEVEVKTA